MAVDEARVGFAAHKLPLRRGASRDEWERRNREMLARVLTMKTTVAFLGSGCSASLGYPTWRVFALNMVSATRNWLANAVIDTGRTADLSRLDRFQRQLTTSSTTPTTELLFMLGACQRILTDWDLDGPGVPREDGRRAYFALLKDLFIPPTIASTAPNPYEALFDLPITRFVTSNYDCELEEALVRKRDVPKVELGLEIDPYRSGRNVRRRAFTQTPEDHEQLALFVMARHEAATNMVFHCHGWRHDPETMVVTEADYQKWYLSDEGGQGIAFRQTLDILFGSNPILFIGFSLADEDLLRPLRSLVATNVGYEQDRPWFVLMAESAGLSPDERDANRDRYEQFQERFGVHVIPYSVDMNASPTDRGQALCDAITDLETFRTTWRQQWLEKPVFRRPSVAVRPPDSYIHYTVATTSGEPLAGYRINDLLEELRTQAEGDAKVIVIQGPGGTGKSWCAYRFLDNVTRSRSFDGYFFWSSYYSNDALTALDRALAYLEGDTPGQGSRVERLSRCLREGRYLLVFDGFERFLQETPNPIVGKAYTAVVESLLEAMYQEGVRSTVLLTTRLWPESLGLPEHPNEGVKVHRMPYLTLDDVTQATPYRTFQDRQKLSSLCSLADGHAYALVLAGEVIRRAQHPDECLSSILWALSNTPPDRRVSRMIRVAVEDADAAWRGLAQSVLERLSVFMAPVPLHTVRICVDLASRAASQTPPGTADDLLAELLERRLLHKVVAGRHPVPREAYTVHPIVRAYLYQRVHPTSTDSLPSFSLPGFTAISGGIDPGGVTNVEQLRQLFDELCVQSEREYSEGRREVAIGLCRSAFSAFRSRMESTTAPRWCSYDEYLQFMSRLANLAKTLAPRVWSYVERNDVRSIEDDNGPLYAEELAWIYNEIGLTLYAQGSMLDALAVWEQGFEINRVIDGLQGSGTYLLQSYLNFTAGNLNYGRLELAERWIRDAERQNYRIQDSDYAARIIGYRGLIYHLRGDVGRAQESYEEAIAGLRAAGGNIRAESIFRRHFGDLLMMQENLVGAEHQIVESRALAEAGDFPELVASARMAEGHLHSLHGRYPDALREYQETLREARRMGRRFLESEVLSQLARLALDLGDGQTARQRAIESLLIANASVMGLKQTHDLVGLGLATVQTGQVRLGVAYLKHALDQARSQQYWLQGHYAERSHAQYAEAQSRFA